MELKVSSPGNKLSDEDVDRISHDLKKIDRRLPKYKDIRAELRIHGGEAPASFHATLEIWYGPNHLIAKADSPDVGQAVREAREEILRQINDRSRGSHSQYAKGR